MCAPRLSHRAASAGALAAQAAWPQPEAPPPRCPRWWQQAARQQAARCVRQQAALQQQAALRPRRRRRPRDPALCRWQLAGHHCRCRRCRTGLGSRARANSPWRAAWRPSGTPSAALRARPAASPSYPSRAPRGQWRCACPSYAAPSRRPRSRSTTFPPPRGGALRRDAPVRAAGSRTSPAASRPACHQ